MTKRFIRASLLGSLILAFIVAGPLTADVNKPRPEDRRIVFVVTTLIHAQHISKKELDDEISQRAIKAFLQGYDPYKLYFSQQDIDEFMKEQTNLDDQLADKSVEFAYSVFKRYAQRVEERTRLAIEVLKRDLAFDKDEEFVTDTKAAQYATTAEEFEDLWRRRVKYDFLQLKADEVEDKVAKERLERRYNGFLRRVKQTNDDELLERYLTAVASAYDPHTSYFSPNTLDDFHIRMALNYQGIGAELQDEDGAAVIRRVIPGGAAEKQGQLKAKDRIVSVGQGKDGEMVDVRKSKLEGIIDVIRGKEGTLVRIGVISAGEKETKIYEITRAKIELADSAAKSEIIEAGQRPDGKPLRVGVIDLPSFYLDMEAARSGGEYRSTTRDVKKILDEFKEKNVDVVLLDLRRNGGGSLSEAIGVTGLFIDQGTVVQVKDSAGKIEKFDDRVAGMAWDKPLVVATSRFSASASEIVAGAVQDYGRGIVVGDKSTHGKGTVQSLLELGPRLFRIDDPPNLGALKITMQQFYRPGGASTQERGVVADIVVPSLSSTLSKGESELDYALDFDSVDSAEFTHYGMAGKDVLKKLNDASQQRRAESDDFKNLNSVIERVAKQRKRKAIPLHEEKYRAYRKSLRSQDDSDDKTADDDKKKPDFYLNEIASISGDYYRALGDDTVAGK
ncbi:MAG: carboxy terminal-processing peptidase [Pirellulaceae bacterium]|nr:carboxy terminal-processing peptidase [Pirellulaceae bacterium]MDP7017170.1 carboxy terminal-processing peptidase [Pirellulaceae bacterium]